MGAEASVVQRYLQELNLSGDRGSGDGRECEARSGGINQNTAIPAGIKSSSV